MDDDDHDDDCDDDDDDSDDDYHDHDAGGDDYGGEGQRQRYAGRQVGANLNKSCPLFVATFLSLEPIL